MSLTLTTAGRKYEAFAGTLGDWSTVAGTPSIVSGELNIPNGEAELVILNDVWGTQGDQRSYVVVKTTNANLNLYPIVRAAATNSYYVAWFGPDAVTIYKRTTGSWAQVGSGGAAGTGLFTTNDVLALTATGTTTTTLKAYKNGSEVLSVTDSSSPHQTGKAGLRAVNNGASAAKVDDWEGQQRGNVVVTGLTTGWYARLTVGGTNVDAQESSGTATCSPATLTAWSAYTLEIWNGNPASGGVRQDIHTVTAYAGETWAYTAVSVTQDNTLIMARREGTGARLAWASDPAVAHFDSHKVHRNGALVATVATPVCWYLAASDTAGDVYWVTAYEGSANTGRVLESSPTKAASTLTIDSASASGVACSWSAVTGATGYTLYRNPSHSAAADAAYWVEEQQWEQVYTGTGTSYIDTAPLDGQSYYRIVAAFSGGLTSVSAEQSVQLVLTKYISPQERGLETRWFANTSPSGALQGVDYLPNYYNHGSAWLEDVANLLWLARDQPLTMSRYGEAIKDYIAERLNTVPVAIKEFAWHGYRHATWKHWNGATGVGRYTTNTHEHYFDFGASPATWQIGPFEFHESQDLADIRFGYKVDGGATTTIDNFTTRTVSFDDIGQRCVVNLEKVAGAYTVHFTLTIHHGRTTVSYWATDSGATHAVDPVLIDRQKTGDGSVVNYDGTTYYIRSYKSFGVDGNGDSADIGTMCRYQRLTGAWTTTGSTTETTIAFSLGTAPASPPAATDLCYVQGGENQYPLASYGQYYTNAVCAESYCLGSPLIQARVAVAGAVWLEKHPTDTAFKTTLDAFLAAAFAQRANVYANLVTWNRGGLCAAYSILLAAFPADSTYSANRTTLWGERPTAASISGDEAAWWAMGAQEYGDLTAAAEYAARVSTTATNPTVSLGASLVAQTDYQSAAALNLLSYLLRRAYWEGYKQLCFNDLNNPTGHGTTGEATAHAVHALGVIRRDYGDVCPVRVGRTASSNGYDFTDGTFTAYSWNAGTNVFTIAVDKDVWLYTGAHGEPTAVKRSAGAVTLTETGTDPGAGTMTADYWYFDTTCNLLKIGVTSAQTLTVELPAVTFALNVTNVDTQGCNLDHTIYSGADFTSYKLWRSLTSSIDGTGGDVLMTTEYDPGVNTYHDTGAPAGSTVYYRVELVTESGSVWSDEETVEVLPLQVSRDLDLLYNVAAPIGQEFIALWNDLVPVAQESQLLWNILTPVTQAFDALWNDYLAVGASLDALWHVPVAVGQSTQLVWNVIGGLNVTAYGAVGDGVTDDTDAIEAAIAAAAGLPGSNVYFPAGTYLITNTLAMPAQVSYYGDGATSVLTMPAQLEQTYIFSGTNRTGVSITDLKLAASATSDDVSGIYMPGAIDCTIARVWLENLRTGIKTGSGAQASGWLIEDITATGCRAPLYVSYTNDSTFNRLTLNSVSASSLDHCIYMERSCNRLTFNDTVLTGGGGYCLQLYSSATPYTDSITFNTVSLDSRAATGGRYPMVVGGYFTNIVINGLTAYTDPNEYVVLRTWGSTLSIDGITAVDGYAFISHEDTSAVSISNGTYDGPALLSTVPGEDVAEGLTFTNVELLAAGAVGRDLDVLWHVTEMLGRSVGALWNVRAPAGQDLALLYHVLSPVAGSLDALWNVLTNAGAVGADLDLLYHVRALISGDLDALWNVRLGVGQESALLWNVRSCVGNEEALLWHVLRNPDFTLVSRDLALLYHVRALISQDVSVLWRIDSNRPIVFGFPGGVVILRAAEGKVALKEALGALTTKEM